MSAPVLKPCPFCGSAPSFSAHSSHHKVTPVSISCEDVDCPAGPVVHEIDEATAVRAWNTRAVI